MSFISELKRRNVIRMAGLACGAKTRLHRLNPARGSRRFTPACYPYLSPNEAIPKAKAAAQRALEIDPTLPEAHTFLAYALAVFDWDWGNVEREFKLGIELDPKNPAAHFRYAQMYLAPIGRSATTRATRIY